MAKENQTLSLYRANRERGRKAADAALTKAVASVAKKAAGKTGKPIVEEVPPAGAPPAGAPPADQPPAGDPPSSGDQATADDPAK